MYTVIYYCVNRMLEQTGKFNKAVTLLGTNKRKKKGKKNMKTKTIFPKSDHRIVH